MESLQQGSITASEVAYKVGFGSPAYFNTCFHEYFGYPPGEVLKRGREECGENNLGLAEEPEVTESESVPELTKKAEWYISFRQLFIYSSIILVIFIGLVWMTNIAGFKNSITLLFNPIKVSDKSIAILPFISLSSDVENKYFAEGVTRDILSNLIQVSEIKVINSPVRGTEGEMFNLKKTADKLKVRFFLSGSVQKSGEQILVMAQLTDTAKNQIIWSDKYTKKPIGYFLHSERNSQTGSNKFANHYYRKRKGAVRKGSNPKYGGSCLVCDWALFTGQERL